MDKSDKFTPDGHLKVRHLALEIDRVYSLNLSTSQGRVGVARRESRLPNTAPGEARSRTALAMKAVKGDASKPPDAPKTRQIHKAGEVNISAYFPAEVKASLRMVQAKTGYNVKDCLAEALRDLFRKHKVPVSLELGEGR